MVVQQALAPHWFVLGFGGYFDCLGFG